MRVTLSFGAIIAIAPFIMSGATTISLEFDSVALSAGACTDASPYLTSFGITFVPVSTGASSVICNAVGSAITPSSGTNIFEVAPPITNNNVSYDLLFSTPLGELSFTRTSVNPATGVPPWNAYAYNASNTLLSSVGEGFRFPGPSAQSFTLTGPGITRLHVDAFNSLGTTFNHPPLDNMILTPGTTVLPGADTLYVSYYGSGGGMLQINPDGVITPFGSGGFQAPDGLLFNSAGTLYAADSGYPSGLGGGNIYAYAADGSRTVFASGINPYGLAFDSIGNLFVSDAFTSEIYKYTPGGSMSVFTTGVFDLAMAFDRQGNLFGGNIYASTGRPYRIDEYSPSGDVTTFANDVGYVNGMAFDSAGNLFVAEGGGSAPIQTGILKIAPNGTVSVFASNGFESMGGLAIDSAGSLYAADQNLDVIYKFAPDGAQSIFASLGPNQHPYGIAMVKPLCAAPTISALSVMPNVLWPPNHKMVSVNVSGTPSGGCGTVSCKILSVSSNEPIDADGDWLITSALTMNLRAERLGNGVGRIYTITVQCTDASGNSTTKTVTVNVSHDKGH